MPSDCIFCKIAAGEIPAERTYEDDEFLAFPDIHPAAPVHLIVIPKQHVVTLGDTLDDEALAGLLRAAKAAARRARVDASGFRLVINCGPDAGQEVDHIHAHLVGGRALSWPPG